jgi:hypothetical protein
MNVRVAHIERSRPVYAMLAVLVIASGVLWRSGLLPLSGFQRKYGGVALWALVVFLGVACVLRRSSIARVGLTALCIAWAIEGLQLYHAKWIDGIRATSVGHMVLGSTFNAPDLVAYALGIAIGVVAESLIWTRRGARSADRLKQV